MDKKLFERFVVSQEQLVALFERNTVVSERIANAWEVRNRDELHFFDTRREERAEDLALQAQHRADDLARFARDRADDKAWTEARDAGSFDRLWGSAAKAAKDAQDA